MSMQSVKVGQLVRCLMCGQEWESDMPFAHTGSTQYPITPPATTHTEAEWEAWRIQQGIPDGQAYNRREFLDFPPPDPSGPPPD
jgi:hypothetical protein